MSEAVTSNTISSSAAKPKRGPRGQVVIFGKWCKGCGLCVEFCPTHVLSFDEWDEHPVVVRSRKMHRLSLVRYPLPGSCDCGQAIRSLRSRGVTIKLMQGNEAVAWGALAAGCRFYAGYPITPSTEIAEMPRPGAAQGGRQIHPDGRRDCQPGGLHRCLGGRPESP